MSEGNTFSIIFYEPSHIVQVTNSAHISTISWSLKFVEFLESKTYYKASSSVVRHWRMFVSWKLSRINCAPDVSRYEWSKRLDAVFPRPYPFWSGGEQARIQEMDSFFRLSATPAAFRGDVSWIHRGKRVLWFRRVNGMFFGLFGERLAVVGDLWNFEGKGGRKWDVGINWDAWKFYVTRCGGFGRILYRIFVNRCDDLWIFLV